MNFNPTNTIKNSFLNFVRYFFDDQVQYTEHLTRKWIKALIPFFLNIIIAGAVFYGVIKGLVFVFPKLSTYIFTGTVLWHVPVIILSLGLIHWFFEDRYKYIRGGYKK